MNGHGEPSKVDMLLNEPVARGRRYAGQVTRSAVVPGIATCGGDEEVKRLGQDQPVRADRLDRLADLMTTCTSN